MKGEPIMRNAIKSYRITALVLALIVAFASMPNITAEAATAKPAKVTISSAKRATNNKTITIKFKKVSKATGYQIAYKKTTSKKYTTKKTTKTTYKLSVTAKADYQIRVRAYRKSGSKTVYGAWSAVKHNHSYTKKVSASSTKTPVYKTVTTYEDKEVWGWDYVTEYHIFWKKCVPTKEHYYTYADDWTEIDATEYLGLEPGKTLSEEVAIYSKWLDENLDTWMEENNWRNLHTWFLNNQILISQGKDPVPYPFNDNIYDTIGTSTPTSYIVGPTMSKEKKYVKLMTITNQPVTSKVVDYYKVTTKTKYKCAHCSATTTKTTTSKSSK